MSRERNPEIRKPEPSMPLFEREATRINELVKDNGPRTDTYRFPQGEQSFTKFEQQQAGSSSQRTERRTSNAEVSGSIPGSPTKIQCGSIHGHKWQCCRSRGHVGDHFSLDGTVWKPRAEQAHARRNDPETSHQAAASVTNITPLKRNILKIFRLSGWITDEQLIANYRKIFGEASLASDAGIRSRRADLVRDGELKDSGTIGKTVSGRNCTIWRLK